ncbi:MauE/DoxX family redox-associated membrane protein [Mucilaginibacter sp.]|uniref:MauE/DoxX family redox-associated membrane protein n=1 Tax=Mucilaginibacter sp. TaxID=1882438 RepID=UPI002686E608
MFYMKTVQLPYLKLFKTEHLLTGINIIIFSVFFFLGIYQLVHRDLFMIKIGMSHFFSIRMIGILSYLIPAVLLGAPLFLLFINKRGLTFAFEVIIFLFYAVYNSVLIATTGETCGCANIFVNIDLRYQICGSILLICLSMISFFIDPKSKIITSVD